MNGLAAITMVSKIRLAAPYEIIEVGLGDMRVCLKIISMWIALSNVPPPITFGQCLQQEKKIGGSQKSSARFVTHSEFDDIPSYK